MSETQKETAGSFILKVLNGATIAIVVALIPNAILATFLKPFASNPLFANWLHIVQVFQYFTPLMAGYLISMQFKLNPIQSSCVGGAAYIGSGAWKFVEVTMDGNVTNIFRLAGIGDVINTMLTAAIAVGMLMLIKDRFGSTAVVAMPIVVGVGAALIGLLLLPFVKQITTGIGVVINEFTHLQPLLMSILICCSFAFIIISPISTVAIGLAIQLNGISAGASAMGVAATAVALVVHSWKVNNSGVTLAIALGAMKLMMPNVFKYPIILVPCLTTAVISAIPVALFSVSGTAQSAGFGLVGLVGPLASIDAGLNIALAVVVWLIVPILAALASKIVFEKILKLYDSSVVFKFQD